MKQNNVTSLRDMLEQLSTQQLDEMLSMELSKNQVDADAIRIILDVLYQREKGNKPEITPETRAAFETYRCEIRDISESTLKKNRFRAWSARAASLAAACLLVVMLIPQRAEADSLWNRLARWTNEIVEFFSPDDNKHRFESYQFKTDNPGLQQVYDAVVEMGITEPVVPMWLPDGSELIELKVKDYPKKKRIYSCFVHNGKDMIFCIDLFFTETARTFHITESEIEKCIIEETTFNIMKNNENWVAIWTDNNIECSIFIDCQEDTLHEVLRSIYMMEENK